MIGYRLALALTLLFAAATMSSATMLDNGIGPATSGVATPCTSTGIYDLSNVCNDIYFIGALR